MAAIPGQGPARLTTKLETKPATICRNSASPARQGLAGLLGRLVGGADLSRSEAYRLVESLLSPEATDAQIGAALALLAAKGETVEELVGMASAMRDRAARIVSRRDVFIDTAGTGASRAKTFNVSTAAAFVIAGAGVAVAKHGNRAATSKSGSADVLTALGVGTGAALDVSERCLNELGLCFMFAPLYHTATGRVAAVRRELGVYTPFNLLGPLTNPAGAPFQILGVWHQELVPLVAEALAALGTRRAWVVHGLDGLDEISLSTNTLVADVTDGEVRLFDVGPRDFGFAPTPVDHLRHGEPRASAEIIRAILDGGRRDEARALVVMNAAAALVISGLAADLGQGRALAEQSLDSGAARRKLDQLILATN